jgi:predicted nucleic acid-binding protein
VHYFFFDASALAKRYHYEPGSEVANYLLDALLSSAPERVVISPLILCETISVLSHEHNSGRIPVDLFQKATARLLLEARAMNQQSIDNETILHSIRLISRHNLNASDALFLHQALNLHELLKTMEQYLVLVASDRRLLRAAEDKGLLTLNPEETTPPDAEALLRT